eukprot:g4536.t1
MKHISWLLKSIGGQREVKYWFEHYSGEASMSKPFAIIKVGGGVVESESELNSLCGSLVFLQRSGLFPIVVHGAGPQLNKALEKEGIVSDYIGGIRITPPNVLRTARSTFLQVNRRLVSALESRGTLSEPVDPSVFEARFRDKDTYGYVGDVTGVKSAWVQDVIERGKLPVVSSLGESKDGQTLNINADVAAVELASAMQPLKVIYINSAGGLRDENDELIRNLNYPSDYERLLKEPWLRHGTQLKVNEINRLLQRLPPSSTVSVTSPENLMRELFTHQGAGTLCRRETSVAVHDSLDKVDTTKLTNLLVSSFDGRTIHPTYLENLRHRLYRIYVTGGDGEAPYDGAIVLTRESGVEGDIPYMDKFSVSTHMQGMGTGIAMWNKLREDEPRLFWRSRGTNPINNWYFSSSDFCAKLGLDDTDWRLFAYGVDLQRDASTVADMRVVASRIPPTFVSSSSSAAMPQDLYTEQKDDAQELETSSAAQTSATTRSMHADSASGRDVHMHVGIIGARGYVGAEIIRLVGEHPQMTLAAASSRSLQGQSIARVGESLWPDEWMNEDSELQGIDPGMLFDNFSPAEAATIGKERGINLWFLALPNGLASDFVAELSDSSATIIDMSADYRFDSTWDYGFNERNRSQLAGSMRISNPGCYATGAQVGLLPLVENGVLAPFHKPRVFGVSGYSGAGTNPSDKNNPDVLRENLLPYALTGHIHEREISSQLGVQVAFMPHVAPHFRGIGLTLSADLSTSTTASDLQSMYEEFYSDEPLINVSSDAPQVSNIAGEHSVDVGGFSVNEDGTHAVLHVTIDNLLKGAATQAVQNANSAFGLPHTRGIGGRFQRSAMAPQSAGAQRRQFSTALHGKSLLSLCDLEPAELDDLLLTSADLKSKIRKQDDGSIPSGRADFGKPLDGETMAMIFQKRSTRTRVSAETAMAMCGGHALFLGSDDIQLGVNESILDTARVLSRFNSLILARVFEHADVEELAQEASVPVINALSDLHHPLQILADLQTLREHVNSDNLSGMRVAWVGDGNNILHSLMTALPKLGVELAIATPENYGPDEAVRKVAERECDLNGTTMSFTDDPREAVRGANTIITDTWISMGQEEEKKERLRAFAGYQVTRKMLAEAADDWCFLHCLPRKPEEVDDEVFYSDRSLVWDEAENRMWTVMAVILHMSGKLR